MTRVVSILACVALLVGSAPAADDSLQTYLEVSILEGHDFTYETSGASGSCCISYERACNGSYYVKGKESGINVGAIGFGGPKGADYELDYSLALTRGSDKDILVGALYSLQLSGGESVTGGRKIRVNSPVEYGQPDTIKVSESIGVEIRVVRHAPGQFERKSSGPLTLVSVQEYDGRVRSVASNSAPLSKERSFQSGFNLPSGDTLKTLEYRTTISFSEPLEGAVYPLQCVVTFKRMYLIDAQLLPGKRYEAKQAYVSNYSKSLTLQPGKISELIFPPDSPSVEGFEITDTLIISPPEE